MHKLTRIALVGTSPAVAARVKAALEARGSARDCDPIALVGPVGAPLTATDDQEARLARQAMAYREMLALGMVVPLVGMVGDGYVKVREDFEANIRYYDDQIKSTESKRSKRGDEETDADLRFFRAELAKEKAGLAKLK